MASTKTIDTQLSYFLLSCVTLGLALTQNYTLPAAESRHRFSHPQRRAAASQKIEGSHESDTSNHRLKEFCFITHILVYISHQLFSN